MSDRLRRLIPVAVVACALVVVARPASAQFVQQGSKLVGSGSAPNSDQGWSVALSADGNTAIVGAPYADSFMGAAWIWTRSGATWTQQGNKLVATGGGSPELGLSVAMSADGNTAIVGGFADNSGMGAAWVFVRSGGSWSQQGSKLVGTGAAGAASQGSSVAISADGNTAIVGGEVDDNGVGAAWVFVRIGGTWMQQGAKLVGARNFDANQGESVALSADGNTALIGGPGDGNGVGSVWVFTRSGGTWTQQGRLAPSGVVGTPPLFGVAVAVSADGNTAAIGGWFDDPAGATWVFTRSGSTWTQQGPKLVGTGVAGNNAQQGRSVAISGDGNTIIEGGPIDGRFTGAAWIFTRSNNIWSQFGPKLVGTGAVGGAEQGLGVGLSNDGLTAIVGGPGDNSQAGAEWIYTRSTPISAFSIPDLDGDGQSDLVVWRGTTGNWYWLTSSTGYDVAQARSRQWGNQALGDIPLTGDIDGDGKADLVIWRPSTGTWYWLTSSSGYNYAAAGSKQWGASTDIPMLGDIDGDGKAELIVWRPGTGTWYWLTSSSGYNVGAAGSKQFGNQSLGDTPLLGDFDGDGKVDLTVWRASTGTWYWLTSASGYNYANMRTVQWGNSSLGDVPLLGDADGDGKADLIVWRASTAVWYYLTSLTAYDPGQAVRLQWGNASLGDVPMLGKFDGDAIVDLTVWRASTGTWYWLTSTSNYNPAASRSKQWAPGDIPMQLVVPPMVR